MKTMNKSNLDFHRLEHTYITEAITPHHIEKTLNFILFKSPAPSHET